MARRVYLWFWSLLAAVPSLFAEESAAGEGDTALREQLEALLRVDEPTVGFVAVALGVAFLAGAAHALTPGHGKAVVAAYLAGSRGTIGDAIYLGTVVTVTHTAGVFALGLIALYASQYLLVDRLLVWLSFASGLLIVFIGGWLFWDRWQMLRSSDGGGDAHEHRHWPLGKAHSHVPGHAHSHSHDHDDHSHTHSHSHGEHTHAHSHGEHSHTHSHGEHEHSHDDQHEIPKTGRGSLLSLGISGGLVPCPEALAVLLISFTINRLVWGLVILVAFSLGLAAVLIAIGVAMVLAGPALKRMTTEGRWLKVLPVGSALVVTLLGVVILYRTAVESGML